MRLEPADVESLKFYLDEERLRVFTFEPSVEHLDAGYRRALPKLLRAVEKVDSLFLMQDHPQSLELREWLSKGGDSSLRMALDVFRIFNGPEGVTYDNETVPLFSGVAKRPKGGTLYPPDLTSEELEAFLKELPGRAEEFKKINTAVERVGGSLVAVPYEVRYKGILSEVAQLLEGAASDVPDAAFSSYLRARASALLSGDFFESDVAWIRSTGSPVDVAIGPLESYHDRVLGRKAFYAGLVCLKSPEESARVGEYVRHLQALEDALPQDSSRAKRMERTNLPVAVVDILYMAGDYQAKRTGITVGQTLPNDKRVLER